MSIRTYFLRGFLLGLAFNLNGAVLYTVTDLGTLAGGETFARGINNAGQVTGSSLVSSDTYHAFLYGNDQMTDLGTLGGLDSVGQGINNAGQVTGSADDTNNTAHAFLYSGGKMIDLTPGGSASHGAGINNAGQIVGDACGHAFLYTNGMLVDLGTFGVSLVQQQQSIISAK